MGMSERKVFTSVELPLAMPVVMTGVRLALVQVWATATIAALVAGPGLGRIITRGFANQALRGGGRRGPGRGRRAAPRGAGGARRALRATRCAAPAGDPRRSCCRRSERRRAPTRTLSATGVTVPMRVPAAVPIGHARGAPRGTQKVVPHATHSHALSAAPGRAAPRLAAGCGDDDRSRADSDTGGDGGDKGSVVVGGQDFTESQVLAAIYQQLLEDEGYSVETKLVTTRDVYLPELAQRQRRHRPRLPRRSHRLPQHRGERPGRRAGVEQRPRRDARGARAARRGRGHLDPAAVGGHRPERLLRDRGVRRGERPRDALRPRRAGPADQARRPAGLRGPRRLRGRAHRGLRARHHRDRAARLRAAPR